MMEKLKMNLMHHKIVYHILFWIIILSANSLIICPNDLNAKKPKKQLTVYTYFDESKGNLYAFNPNQVCSNGSYLRVNQQSDKNFLVVPNTGYRIQEVLLNNDSINVPNDQYFSFIFRRIMKNSTVRVTFVEIGPTQFTISTQFDPSKGTIQPSDPSGSMLVDAGSSQTFVISPASGYNISSVIIDGMSQTISNKQLFTKTFTNIQENHTIDVTFAWIIIEFNISTLFDSNKGNISPTGPGSVVKVVIFNSQTFVVTPKPNYKISQVTIDNSQMELLNDQYYDYTFMNVLSNHSIQATFIEIPPQDIDNDGDGFTENQGDCNDGDITIYPGAMDFCGDGIDQNCSGADRACGEVAICVDISDSPLETQVQAAPPNIMFLIDDSGSMDWSFITPESDGKFQGSAYVFDNPGDNIYSSSTYRVIPSEDRVKWKSQWAGYNKMYYNPTITYKPWVYWQSIDSFDPPNWPEVPNADPDTPRSNPMFGALTANMNSIYCQIGSLSINNAHYYEWSYIENKPYLIILNGSINYYAVNNGGAEVVEAGHLQYTTSPPSDVITSRSYVEERQNFANWYSFYRRREFTAKAALGNVLVGLEGVNIGMYSINQSVKQTVLPVKVNDVTDMTFPLLEIIYTMRSVPQGTPLRRGLQSIGRYYHQDDGETGNIGPSPYASAAEGGACQQAFTIMMTDGYYNGNSPYVGNMDGDGDTDFDGGIFGDTYSNTLSDVAMLYYEKDLSNSLENIVPINAFDRAYHQHMVTYGVSFGVIGTFNPEDYPTCPPDCPTWPEPNTNNRKIDDMWHATVNGRGRYMSAENPQQLITALESLKQDIENRRGSGASITTNALDLRAETVLYQTIYQTDYWSGDLRAYGINQSNGHLNPNYVWSSADELEKQDWDTGRKIITYNGQLGIPFRYDSLTLTQKNKINTNAIEAQKMIDFIRGNNSYTRQNGGQFRDRQGKLGDLIHSEPVLVNGMIIVGGNDGMFHIFDANTGREKFSYISNHVFHNLYNLTDFSYHHKYFVDGTAYWKYIKDIDKTYAVCGLGKGGKGYFCLDISPPLMSQITTENESYVASNVVKWEYPDSDAPAATPNEDSDLGYSFSDAYITNSTIGWVVIFGNGYDSANGKAILYVLDAFTGQLIKKIDTGIGNSTDQCNGMSTPSLVDINADDKVDYVYAGDLLGNLWKFDLRADQIEYWHIAFEDATGKPMPLFQARNTDSNYHYQAITCQPEVMRHCVNQKKGYIILFGTGRYLGNTDFEDNRMQTIYGIWDWAEEWEALGITPKDKYYGYLKAPEGFPPTRRMSNFETKEEIKNLTLLEQIQIYYENGIRILSNYDVDWFDPNDGIGSHVGWLFNLPITNERVTQDPILKDGKLLVISQIPSSSPCSAGGTSIFHEMNACDGGRLLEAELDINDDDDINTNDLINIGTEDKPEWIAPTGITFQGLAFPPAILSLDDKDMKYFSNSLGSIETIAERKKKRSLIYWREW